MARDSETHYFQIGAGAEPESTKLVLHPRVFTPDSQEIKDALAEHAIEGARFLDASYRVLPEHEALEVAQRTHTRAFKYVSEYADCDDFAFCFRGLVPLMSQINSVGLVINYAGHHAFNCMFVRDSADVVKLRLVEPQSDTEVKFGSSPPYTLVQGQYQVTF